LKPEASAELAKQIEAVILFEFTRKDKSEEHGSAVACESGGTPNK
jgi:hypothetical protein